MYTKLEDAKQTELIKYYMNAKPKCTLKDIIQDCYVTRYRLTYLERNGYLTIPEPTPLRERNGLFRQTA